MMTIDDVYGLPLVTSREERRIANELYGDAPGHRCTGCTTVTSPGGCLGLPGCKQREAMRGGGTEVVGGLAYQRIPERRTANYPLLSIV